MKDLRRRDGMARYFVTGIDSDVPHAEGECVTCDEIYEIVNEQMGSDPALADTIRRIRMRQSERAGMPHPPIKGDR